MHVNGNDARTKRSRRMESYNPALVRLCIRQQVRSKYSLEAVKLADNVVYYTTRGTRRGSCEHKHRTVAYAYHCLRHDIQACQKEGTISDRRIYAVEDGKERELVEREIYELDYAKRLVLGKTILKQEQSELKSRLMSDDR
ncbi:hypothetical protein [Methanothrix sp.]|uniref:hypothetical protein n=1 Tax=Methanothrix sp. TaxID=90426 RepID=UPI001BD44617